MGEDSEPETGSDAVDGPRSEPSEASRAAADQPDARADAATDGSVDTDDDSVDADGVAGDADDADGTDDDDDADRAADDAAGSADADDTDGADIDDDADEFELGVAESVAEAVPEVSEPSDAAEPVARRPESSGDRADAEDASVEYGPFPASDPRADPTPPVAAETDAVGAPDYADVDDYADDDPEYDFDVGDGLLGEGPEDDEEMPLADHIEEMVRRLGVVFLIAGVVLLVVFPFADQIINFLWNAHIPGAASPTSPRRPRLYGPLELILTELKVAGLAGLVAGLPVFVYQTYKFMRPGLYTKERRYYLASVPTSLILAFVGIAFAHFIVLPAIFAYFTSYTARADIVVAFGLRETFNLILLLMGYMALVFQIPLFMMLAVMMGLVTRSWMTDKRLLFWGGFLGVAFLVSPDPTGMAPIIVAATMISLFEGTLLLLKWTGR